MRIIPAIDIIDNKCVRLTRGDYSDMNVYSSDPLEMALRFEDAGCRYVHIVDLDGAKSRHIVNSGALERIASSTGLKIDFGGGIRCDKDVEAAFNSGASQVVIGSVAVTSPQLFIEWLYRYGPEKIILGADFRNGAIAINGWKDASEVSLSDLLRSYRTEGVRYAICTDISKDGTLEGPSAETYGSIISNTGINIIASGGIRKPGDIGMLEEAGCEGVIIGKALYENKITLKELSELCLKKG